MWIWLSILAGSHGGEGHHRRAYHQYFLHIINHYEYIAKINVARRILLPAAILHRHTKTRKAEASWWSRLSSILSHGEVYFAAAKYIFSKRRDISSRSDEIYLLARVRYTSWREKVWGAPIGLSTTTASRPCLAHTDDRYSNGKTTYCGRRYIHRYPYHPSPLLTGLRPCPWCNRIS